MFLSDHHPITMSLDFPTIKSQSPIWSLDPSLLTDTPTVHTIQDRLIQYFRENGYPEITQLIQWEAHKCYIRGEFMAMSAKKTREKQAYISQLIKNIHALEMNHKRTQALSTLQELSQLRAKLIDELNKRTKLNFILSQKLFYEYGNKCYWLLARALRAKRVTTTIHCIHDSTRKKINNVQRANQFVKYYTQLSNLKTDTTQTEMIDNKFKKISF